MELYQLIQHYENCISGYSKMITDIRMSQYTIDHFVSEKKHCEIVLGFLKDLKVYQEKEKIHTEIDSSYQLFVETYFTFYETRIGVKPRFNGVDGKAIKQIIKYLSDVAKGNDALAAWKYILSNWDSLRPFIANQCSISQINKNINEILAQLKYGNSKNNKEKQARDVLSSFD